MSAKISLLLLVGLLATSPTFAEEPDLPAGLEVPKHVVADEPGLPSGLDLETSAPKEEPLLPEGITDPNIADEVFDDAFSQPAYNFAGFWEARLGQRSQGDAYERDTSMLESRVQLEFETYLNKAVFKLTTDLVYDNVADTHGVDLNSGRGWVDLREAYISSPLTESIDIKAGRQILTWGTGDLLFINDLFPKDWNSFFAGRDVEYLKAPSDAVKLAFYSELANLDVMYAPEFDADRFIDGRRLSYYAAALGRNAGRDAIVRPIHPDDVFSDDELALRLYRNIAAFETAVYLYRGYWKSPAGMDAISGRAIFPDLSVYGASLRGPVFKGIANTEIGYYDSRDDDNGTNPLINNSEFRFLIGYEQEIKQDLTAGFQYYLEHLIDYDNYRATLPAGSPARDENRHLLTLRLTLLTNNQNINWSLFAYYSPSDDDYYLRPHVLYKLDDHWSVEAGGNLFGGDDTHSFFGQFEDNTNLYGSVRYYF